MQHHLRIFFASLIALALLAGCTKQQDIAKVREEITHTWKQFAEVWVKGDAAAARWYTEDAINMPPNVEDWQGRSAIQRAFFGILSGVTEVDMALTTRELDVYEDTAYELGTFADTRVPHGGNKVTARARYMCVWKRQPNGTWKIH